MHRAICASLSGLAPGDRVLLALSGGPDSVAMVHAASAAVAGMGLDRGDFRALVVDHQLQAGAAAAAAGAVRAAEALGLHARIRVVEVSRGPGSGGPEAAARTARYGAFEAEAERWGARAVLLGHTLDDQAETVLLGLARGSGARSLAGMRPRDGLYRRPFLGIRRADVHAHASDLQSAGIDIWHDPHNNSREFTRVRVREAMPILAEALDRDPAPALARTADSLRADADALDSLAEDLWVAAIDGLPAGSVRVATITSAPEALRTRVIRRAILAGGVRAGSLTRAHILAVDSLVSSWHGQRAITLPGGVQVVRREGLLQVFRSGVTP